MARGQFDMTEHNYDHLYDVPIETLDLSDEASKAVRRHGLENVGDCVDFYNRNSAPGSVRGLFLHYMANEVMEKIKAHGYWQFVDAAE
ncbi:MAG: hypothetical protein RLP44_30715 [Aggregatilineales bacterium]